MLFPYKIFKWNLLQYSLIKKHQRSMVFYKVITFLFNQSLIKYLINFNRNNHLYKRIRDVLSSFTFKTCIYLFLHVYRESGLTFFWSQKYMHHKKFEMLTFSVLIIYCSVSHLLYTQRWAINIYCEL